MNGLRRFYNNCKDYKQTGKIILKLKVYSRLLRWIITKNNPRYFQLKFDEFKKLPKCFGFIYLVKITMSFGFLCQIKMKMVEAR